MCNMYRNHLSTYYFISSERPCNGWWFTIVDFVFFFCIPSLLYLPMNHQKNISAGYHANNNYLEVCIYPCKSVTLFSINMQQFNTTYKLFRYFLHSGVTRIQRMTCKCQWSYNGNFSKVIGNLKSGIYLRWYLNFLLVYFSMKNLINSSNNKLNLTTLFFYRVTNNRSYHQH